MSHEEHPPQSPRQRGATCEDCSGPEREFTDRDAWEWELLGDEPPHVRDVVMPDGGGRR